MTKFYGKVNRYQKPDCFGHMTRFSDSSMYDEVCIFCGHTDCGDYLNFPCPEAFKYAEWKELND